MFPIPIRVVEDAVLRVDGSCVTAETGDKTLLLIFDLILANVVGDEVWLEDRDPDTPTLRVLSSGVRYQIRGVPDPFDAELKEPLPPGCEYDERLILLGALDTPVGHGLRTRPVEGWEAVGGMGYDGTPTITIAGACDTRGAAQRLFPRRPCPRLRVRRDFLRRGHSACIRVGGSRSATRP
jgi:hypothetical protein